VDHTTIFHYKIRAIPNQRLVTYTNAARSWKKNKERCPQIEGKFTGKPPIIRHSASYPQGCIELQITQESLKPVGGEKGVYGVERKITSIMADGHSGQIGLMDLNMPPRSHSILPA
jgi:hypothetical protein